LVCREAYKDIVCIIKYTKEADNCHGIGQGRFTSSVKSLKKPWNVYLLTFKR